MRIPLSHQVYGLYSIVCKYHGHAKSMHCRVICANTHITPSLCLVQECVQCPYYTKSMPCTGMCAMPLLHQVYALYRNVCKYLCHTKPMLFTTVSANTLVIPSLCLAQECVQIPLSHQLHALYRNVCIYTCHPKSIPCTVKCVKPLSHQVHTFKSNVCKYPCHTKPMPCAGKCQISITSRLCLVQL